MQNVTQFEIQFERKAKHPFNNVPLQIFSLSRFWV